MLMYTLITFIFIFFNMVIKIHLILIIFIKSLVFRLGYIKLYKSNCNFNNMKVNNSNEKKFNNKKLFN